MTASPMRAWQTSVSRCEFSGVRKDRKSTRLNSSHGYISYAVFCLKKKHPTRTANDISVDVGLRLSVLVHGVVVPPNGRVLLRSRSDDPQNDISRLLHVP